MFLAMRLPIAGAIATITSAIVAAGSAAEGVSPWVPIGMSATAAVGLVALFRKVQKDIIGEQDKRYDAIKGDLREARRDALRAKKRAEHAEAGRSRCDAEMRGLKSALRMRNLLPLELVIEDEITPPPYRDPTDAELDRELGYDDDRSDS